ncbi:Uncharacterized protein Tcan_09377 [Toxocara canis]|uniref:NADAR domain-containing protein n=1 Tax=Toxocara canis TaxID=6265 RepID=A0A0B2W554_TOXCA|nr:Uncharacterized protein Tcan_09377 [Toxocara canis]
MMLLLCLASFSGFVAYFSRISVMTLRQSDKEGSAFTFFYTNKSQFSNFYPCTFTVLNETGHPLNFTSSEQYFMHQKAITFKDDAVAQRILQSTSPAEAKALGRKVRNFDAKVWDALSFDVMKRGVFEKFSQNEDLRKELFSTIGSTMVECSPRDRLWGIGIGINDERRMIPSRWKGHNRLGKVLMEVRDQLSESEDFRDEVEQIKKNAHNTDATEQSNSNGEGECRKQIGKGKTKLERGTVASHSIMKRKKIEILGNSRNPPLSFIFLSIIFSLFSIELDLSSFNVLFLSFDCQQRRWLKELHK